MPDGATAPEYAGTGVRLIPRPGLFELLNAAERVVQVSAPAGSGKTFLLRSWIASHGLADRVAWVSVGLDEHDPQSFWLSVLDSLRTTPIGAERVRELTAAPGLDGAAMVERLAEDLSSLEEPVWLVIDDLHELVSGEAIDQLGLLLALAPPRLRLMLLTRRDCQGLHRLRVEGQLTEIRGEDLRFSFDESRALMDAAGVQLSDAALELLLTTTEGWAAGLRLVALSLARHPDPEQYAAGFSGRERVVAEYLVAEVLERQPPEVRRLLLRTSLLEQVNGPLADQLTGCSNSYRILAELEDAGAFVVAVDAERTWFRYHRLFADLLALELRRTAPDELPGLHTIAAGWFAENGHPVDAIRHAQAGEDWGLAARLLADSWRRLYFDGRVVTALELLSRFPADTIAADPELAVFSAGNKIMAGSFREAERGLDSAARMAVSLSHDRRGRFEIQLTIAREKLALARNDLESLTDEAHRLLASTETMESIDFGWGEDVRVGVLIDAGIAEMGAGREQDAERHLEDALVEARRIGRPIYELQALANAALLSVFRSPSIAEQRASQAIELARQHGWEETASAATAYVVLGGVMLTRGRLEEVEPWLDQAERALEYATEPAAALMLPPIRGLLEIARGRHAQMAAANRDGERVEGMLVTPHRLATKIEAINLFGMLARAGGTEQVERALAEMDPDVRETREMRIVGASLRLAQSAPEAAVDILAPIIEDSNGLKSSTQGIEVLLLEAIARDALGDPDATSRALERALDGAEPNGVLLPFLLHPAPDLLVRQTRLRTSHAALISEILNLLSGRTVAARPQDVEPLREPLSESELRVLRYLPTNLRAPEIAGELFVSLNTIRTHQRHLYTKLGVHSRADAVKRGRDLGLLSPSSPRR